MFVSHKKSQRDVSVCLFSVLPISKGDILASVFSEKTRKDCLKGKIFGLKLETFSFIRGILLMESLPEQRSQKYNNQDIKLEQHHFPLKKNETPLRELFKQLPFFM